MHPKTIPRHDGDIQLALQAREGESEVCTVPSAMDSIKSNGISENPLKIRKILIFRGFYDFFRKPHDCTHLTFTFAA